MRSGFTKGIGPSARATMALIVALVVPSAAPSAAPRTSEAGASSRLEALHPDWERYIREIRIISFQAASVSPEGIYSGLVRAGGRDPRIAEDAPLPGQGVRNDVVVFPSALDPLRAPGWLTLILDHEYFHARHLARSAPPPLVDFEDGGANVSYYEATAWSYVLAKAREGAYGELAPADLREVAATYRRHHERFRAFVMERQPSAWLHYGRFLVDPD